MNRFERQRRNANWLLGLLAMAFVLCLPYRDAPGAWPWLFAMLEASLAAACADWFAVTALFRRPFGWPIPHTAIVPRKHADIGAGLVRLIQERLLPVEHLREIVRQSSPAQFLLGHAARTSPVALSQRLMEWLGRIEDADALAEPLHSALTALLRQTAVASRLGGLLEIELSRSDLEGFVNMLLGGMDDLLASEAGARALESQLRKWKQEQGERIEWWKRPILELADKAGALDEAEAARDTVTAVRQELALAQAHPEHALREALRSWAGKLSSDLQGDTALAAAIDEWWAEVVETMNLREPASDLLRHLLSEGSLAGLQPVVASAIGRGLEALREDVELAGRLDAGTRRLISESLPLCYELLAPFVRYVFAQRLTEADLVGFLEEEVGDVLQQLRITGTVVGGIVGLLLAWLTHPG